MYKATMAFTQKQAREAARKAADKTGRKQKARAEIGTKENALKQTVIELQAREEAALAARMAAYRSVRKGGQP